jgi:Ankyrin repeats (3 copies)
MSDTDRNIRFVQSLQYIVGSKLLHKCKEGDVKEVRRLLHDIDFFSQNDKDLALIVSSELNHPQIVKLLIKAGADPSAYKNQTIFKASISGNFKLVKSLLKDERVNPSAHALIGACQNGHLKIVKLLLKHPRVHPSAYKNAALIVASEFGHLEIVKQLLAHPDFVMISSSIHEAIKFALQNGHLKIVELLDSLNTPARAAFRAKSRKSTRKSTRKVKKSTRKVKSVRKSRKVYKSPRKMKKSYCVKTPCGKMGFSQKASCRPYKNCYK